MAKGYAKNLEFAFLVSQTFATSNFSHQMMTWLNLDCELTLYLGKRLYTKRYIYLSICQASKRLWGAKETPVASRREVKKPALHALSKLWHKAGMQHLTFLTFRP